MRVQPSKAPRTYAPFHVEVSEEELADLRRRTLRGDPRRIQITALRRSTWHTVETATEIRAFQVEIPEEKIDDLRRRIAATRWPTKELVEDRSQGVQLATMQELARYWATEYDFGARSRRGSTRFRSSRPRSTGSRSTSSTCKSEHEDALPLIMTHGWPGSVIELLETIGPLTDPTAHGGSAEDAFHLVLPSLPGYGFSGEPTELGW